MYIQKDFKIIGTTILLILILPEVNFLTEKELSDSLLAKVDGGDKGRQKEIEKKPTNVYY